MVVNLLADLKSLSGFGHHSKKEAPRLDCRPHARRRTDNLQQHNHGPLRANSQHIFG
jgi:hypothetical protein